MNILEELRKLKELREKLPSGVYEVAMENNKTCSWSKGEVLYFDGWGFGGEDCKGNKEKQFFCETANQINFIANRMDEIEKWLEMELKETKYGLSEHAFNAILDKLRGKDDKN